jgi:hypothetical protein
MVSVIMSLTRIRIAPLYQSLTDPGLSGLNCPGGQGDRLLLPSPMSCLEAIDRFDGLDLGLVPFHGPIALVLNSL